MYSVAIIISDAGTNLIVPAVPGRRIRVINYNVVCDNNNNTLQFFSNLTPMSGLMNMVRGVPLNIAAGQLFPSGAVMLFQTISNEALYLTTTTPNGVVGGHLTYIITD